MSWQLPSLSSLRTFEAAARHLSFTKAAFELNLTQSAISRQIRTLEEYLGVLLFQRVRQRLVLTEVGRDYLEDIRNALAQMQEATVNLLAHRGKGGMLVLATPPAFATKWLIPRLAEFYRQEPQIVISMVTRATRFDFSLEPIDAAIYYGKGDWPGVLTDPLVGSEMVVACSPDYLQRYGPISTPRDLAKHSLLQQSTRPHLWRNWSKANGDFLRDAWSGPSFEHFYLLLQAAVGGLGVGLLPRVLVEDDLADGRLVQPLKLDFQSDEVYGLVYPPAKRNNPKIELFRRWLLGKRTFKA